VLFTLGFDQLDLEDRFGGSGFLVLFLIICFSFFFPGPVVPFMPARTSGTAPLAAGTVPGFLTIFDFFHYFFRSAFALLQRPAHLSQPFNDGNVPPCCSNSFSPGLALPATTPYYASWFTPAPPLSFSIHPFYFRDAPIFFFCPFHLLDCYA